MSVSFIINKEEKKESIIVDINVIIIRQLDKLLTAFYITYISYDSNSYK